MPNALPFRPWWWKPDRARHRGEFQWATGRRKAARNEPMHITTHQVTLHVYGLPQGVAPQQPDITLELV
jgi:hypothetical protein